MVRLSLTLVGLIFALAPFAARGDNVPDALSVEWQGQKPCEKLYEDDQIRVARCMFPPGSKHVRHSHPGYISYVLSGGKGQIEDAKGTRQVELQSGTYSNSPPLPWHELTNTGDSTLGFLVIERKYEPVPSAEQASQK
jgi:quercetin dioxygenase-like cupin family protein